MPIVNLDPVRNNIQIEVDGLYTLDITEIELEAGSNARLPDIATEGEFNLVWYDSTNYPNPSDDPNVEIVRVTEKLSNDRITITRAQEGTTATSKNTPLAQYKLLLAPTKKLIDDIRDNFDDLETQIENITEYSVTITQANHGFIVGNPIRLNGSVYVKAQANSAVNAEVAGVVISVQSTSQFTYGLIGKYPVFSGRTPGAVSYLSPDVAGAITETVPTTVGQVVKPLLIADSASSGLFAFCFRGNLITAPSPTVATFDAPVDPVYNGTNKVFEFANDGIPTQIIIDNATILTVSGYSWDDETNTLTIAADYPAPQYEVVRGYNS
jgi:hypothetical protein